MVLSDKGGSLCVKDVFAKKFFDAGRDSAGGALVRDRLQAALPRLQQQLEQVRERQCTEQWLEDYAAVKAKRDELVAELRERYPQVVNEMVGPHDPHGGDRQGSRSRQLSRAVW